MPVVRPFVVAAGLVAALAGPAHALKPATHADLADKSCQAQGLPRDFCHRIATEDYVTDANEWTDLAAHAQIDSSQTACDAADAASTRVHDLADELRTRLSTLRSDYSSDRVGELDKALGRTLHTIQDDCAHHGMPNPQHAWFSLTDFCEGTKESPDLDPAAVTCAKAETDAVMRLVAAEVRRTGTASILGGYSCPEIPSNNDHGGGAQQTECDRRYLPAPWQACSFLGEASDWDGIDRTWNNDVVVPALRDAFTRGLAGKPAAGSICNGHEDAIARAVSEPTVDVSGGTPSCPQAHIFCLGKADDVENPFDGDVDPPDSTGCAATGGSRAGLGLVAAALLASRRRRRSR